MSYSYEKNSVEKIQQDFQKFVSSLVNVIGNYQDAMFLYLSVLIANDIRELNLGDHSHVSRYEIAGFSNSNENDDIDVYIVRKDYYGTGGHSGVSAELDCSSTQILDTYHKNETGQWILIQTQTVARQPTKMFWRI